MYFGYFENEKPDNKGEMYFSTGEKFDGFW